MKGEFNEILLAFPLVGVLASTFNGHSISLTLSPSAGCWSNRSWRQQFSMEDQWNTWIDISGPHRRGKMGFQSLRVITSPI